MNEHLVTLDAHQAFWLLAGNTLVHELGVPLPILPTALFMGARAVHGTNDFLLLLVAIVASMVVGNAVWFAAGRRYGVRVLQLVCRLSLTADTCVSRTERAFGQWGSSSLIVGRFLPGVSLIASPMAGALGMSWGKFLALTSAGSALYGLALLTTGVVLRSQIDSALLHARGFGSQAVAAIALALAIYVVWRWWRRRVSHAADVSRISVDELRALIAAGERPLIVDVRGATSRQIDPRLIPEAMVMSLTAIEAGDDPLPRDRKIVLYCACPHEASAAKAARLLLARGYGWARPLRGGLEAWDARDLGSLPLKSSTPAIDTPVSPVGDAAMQ